MKPLVPFITTYEDLKRSSLVFPKEVSLGVVGIYIYVLGFTSICTNNVHTKI